MQCTLTQPAQATHFCRRHWHSRILPSGVTPNGALLAAAAAAAVDAAAAAAALWLPPPPPAPPPLGAAAFSNPTVGVATAPDLTVLLDVAPEDDGTD